MSLIAIRAPRFRVIVSTVSSDAVARRLDLTRAELITRGLRAVLAVEGER